MIWKHLDTHLSVDKGGLTNVSLLIVYLIQFLWTFSFLEKSVGFERIRMFTWEKQGIVRIYFERVIFDHYIGRRKLFVTILQLGRYLQG